MKVLGISPLDKDATASLVEDGVVLFAAGEERFSRAKHHAGFPYRAVEAALRATSTRPDEIDQVVYAFLTPEQEGELMRRHIGAALADGRAGPWRQALARAKGRPSPAPPADVPGLDHPGQRMTKGSAKAFAYRVLGTAPYLSGRVNRHLAERWIEQAVRDHAHWARELDRGLKELGIRAPLRRFEHHLSHAANAYYASGFERALIVSLDGYGSGLHGAVSLGEGGRIIRLKDLRFPHSLGAFYEHVTSSLGFKPDRHAGKIVGLAAYGAVATLGDALLARFRQGDGEFEIAESFNYFYDRHLAASFPMIDVAAAYQHALEVVATGLVRHWLGRTDCGHVVLSGGVAANVKMNQRILETEGVEGLFVYPNMGDGGCGTGLAWHVSRPAGTVGPPISDVYFGPEFDDAAIERALDAEGLRYTRPNNLAAEAARRLHEGQIVARFDGRMEYGPRALGNRSVLYHARDPEVNRWLNKRLGRTEFMPFAPVTLWEARHQCYRNIAGAEHAAQFMTITLDCTDRMREHCPAAVHVDGTARPQLIRREVNPGYYDIVAEYAQLSGIPTVVNTSFNMHEEPIVCTPEDAVRAFLQGHLDVLIAGPYLAEHPRRASADGDDHRPRTARVA